MISATAELGNMGGSPQEMGRHIGVVPVHVPVQRIYVLSTKVGEFLTDGLQVFMQKKINLILFFIAAKSWH